MESTCVERKIYLEVTNSQVILHQVLNTFYVLNPLKAVQLQSSSRCFSTNEKNYCQQLRFEILHISSTDYFLR